MGSSRKPLSSRYDSNKKMRESNEHVIISINDTQEDDKTGTLSSIPAENSKHSALLDALTHNMDSYDDYTLQLGEPSRFTVYENKEEDKDCIEILEINNSTGSPTHDSNMPKTPVKVSQSDTKITKMRQLNFDMSDFETNENHQPRRRIREKHNNEINEQDYCLSAGKLQNSKSLGSLEVSKITSDHKKDDSDDNESNDLTITISPPNAKDYNRNSEYNRTNKELGISNSPEDDFEINENELDENYNTNIYSDEAFDELEKQ
jgi:hypothetical protein